MKSAIFLKEKGKQLHSNIGLTERMFLKTVFKSYLHKLILMSYLRPSRKFLKTLQILQSIEIM